MISLTDTILLVLVAVHSPSNAEDKSCINGIMEVCKRSKRRLSRQGGVATHAKRLAFTALVRPYNVYAVDATVTTYVCTFAKISAWTRTDVQRKERD